MMRKAMDYPLIFQQLLEKIAQETARMSYPGSMSRGKKPVVKGGTKQRLEKYFSSREFPLDELWNRGGQISSHYDNWHKQQTSAISQMLVHQGCIGHPRNDSCAIAAKFLDTFMYQLMKYDRFRSLFPQLHLPLDSRVLGKFTSSSSPTLQLINKRIGTNSAYSISYPDYQFIQNSLWDFIDELNGRQGAEFQVTSRIELNYLWI